MLRMPGSLPYTDAYLQIHGVLRLEEGELILEWRRIMGAPSIMEQVHIPISFLDEVKYSNPFYLFHATLRIRVRNLQLLASVPGSSGAEVTLFCRKRDRRLAQDIANLATFWRLEQVFPAKASPDIARG